VLGLITCLIACEEEKLDSPLLLRSFHLPYMEIVRRESNLSYSAITYGHCPIAHSERTLLSEALDRT